VKRFALAVLVVASWFSLAFGLRAYFGGRAYAARIVGSTELGNTMFERFGEAATKALGISPLVLLALVSLAAALVGASLLWLTAVSTRKLPRGRTAISVAVATAMTGGVLTSIHPLLSLPGVPEGPRTWINFACEAMGYGWVNFIAYAGAFVAVLVFALGARRRAPAVQPEAS
jgi:hypothetical protein